MTHTIPCAEIKNSEHGFTIVEVLVALVLLSIAVLMTIKLTTQNQDALSRTHFQETATVLAQQKLFELEQDGLSAMTAASGNFGQSHPDFTWNAKAHATGRHSSYRLQLSVLWGEKSDHKITIEKLFID